MGEEQRKPASNVRRCRHGSIGQWFLPAVLAMSTLVGGLATCTASDELDLSAWKHLPVFDNGRMMPVNTFATVVVDDVCNKVNPKLSLEGVSKKAESRPGFAAAKEMFPEGRRKFAAAEILFSWMVEPQRWEYVPFLIAEHETLREEILGLPVHSKGGKHLKYVSPYDLEHSEGFQQALGELIEKHRKSMKKVELTNLEQKVERLYRAYVTYRSVTYDPFRGEPRLFNARFEKVADAWKHVGEAWSHASALTALQPPVYDDGVGDMLEAVQSSLTSLAHTMQPDSIDPYQAELILMSAGKQAKELATAADSGMKDMFDRPRPTEFDDARWRQLRNETHVLATRSTDLVRTIEQAQLALYDSSQAVRLLPGLNSAALEKNRDDDNDAQPWVSLQTLLYSGDSLYRKFVRPDLPAAKASPVYPGDMTQLEFLERLVPEGNPARTERAAFAEAAAAYLDRGAADRSERFAAAMERFADELRILGEAIEPARAELALRHPDEELIAATAYPPPGATNSEVYYYNLDPFLWSWLLSFVALCCLGAAFGALRSPMYWLGILFLIVGQAFSIHGFALRTYITGWAPVTNMFETVVFVALVTAVLGLIFALAPLFGPGLRRAWRMTAIPGTPEAGPLEDDDLAMMGPSTWTVVRAAVLIPRLALAVAIFYVLTQVHYGSGSGYTIIRLAPRSESINDHVVWLVGLSMMAIGLWLVPRLVLSAFLGIFTLPWSLAISGLTTPLRKAVDRKAFAAVGAGTAFVVGLIAHRAPLWDANINPLMPVLRDNFWLTLHVLTITASYGAGFLAWGLGITAMAYYIFGRYRNPLAPSKAHVEQGHRPAGNYHAPPEVFHRRVPEQCVSLSGFIYRALQVAVVLLAAGTILGGLWADVSWGRFWGWDSKEVWALISLLIYLGILHFRYIGVLRDFSLAAGAVLGITSIIMAWWGVNFFLGSGLHSYATGGGGGAYVLGFTVFNCIAVAIGVARYVAATGGYAEPVKAPEPEHQREAQMPSKAVPETRSSV